MSEYLVRTCRQKKVTNSKSFLVFKFTVLCLFFALMQVSAKSFSQNVTLSMERVNLQKVFNDVNRQTGIQFFFKDELLNKAGKVSIHVKDMPLKDALSICFANWILRTIVYHLFQSIVYQCFSPKFTTR
jgi:type II secretory pathway component GspD/PulD (secretin)